MRLKPRENILVVLLIDLRTIQKLEILKIGEFARLGLAIVLYWTHPINLI